MKRESNDKTEGDPAFEKRVKRRVTARDHTYYISTTPGLGAMLADEMEGSLGITGERVTGGVEFSARLEVMWQAALHLRMANRILVRLATFPADNFSRLERRVAEIPWELWLPADAGIEVVVATHHCRLYHSDAVAERVERVVSKALKGAGKGGTPQKIYLRGEDDRFTVSLDAVGDALYKRKIKTHGGRAPIRETLAAAVLSIAGYTGGEPLVDPMCGAGTFSLEAAMLATNTPPGFFRSFAFETWPSFRGKSFAHLKRKGAEGVRALDAPVIFASDLDAGAVARLEKTRVALPFGGALGLQVADFFALDPVLFSETPGVVVFNPPYGKRIKGGNNAIVARLLAQLAKAWPGWRAAIVIPRDQVPRPLPRGFEEHPISHGGLDVSVVVGAFV